MQKEAKLQHTIKFKKKKEAVCIANLITTSINTETI